MARRLLFQKFDVLHVIEKRKQELKAKFQRLPQQELGDDTLAARLVDEFSVNVPTLSEAEKYATTRETQIDLSRSPARFILDYSRPLFMMGTEITIHVPFRGAPGWFDVQPGRVNLNPPLGDVKDHELLLLYDALSPAVNVNPEAERNLAQVRHHLDWLRSSGEQLRRELAQLVQSLIAQRKPQISAHAHVHQSLGIPVGDAPDQQRPTGTPPVAIGGQAGQRQQENEHLAPQQISELATARP